MAARTLYVSRPLLNADALRAWALSAGFETALPADDMHVTIAFSRQPVDWSDVPPQSDQLTVDLAPGAARLKDLGAATVLRFDSPALAKRWREFRAAGASWDHPEYQPHVTITYQAPILLRYDRGAYAGPLIFGPERFKEVKTDWSEGIRESPLAMKRTMILLPARAS